MAGICIDKNGEACCTVSGVHLEKVVLEQEVPISINSFRCSFCTGELNEDGVIDCILDKIIGCRANKGSVVILKA